ncbi:membrane fusion protein (multidrug efflux system) [Rhizobium sp. BK529]|uniref:efflux RND transporter periplasmic adaptor subunit n=1 Tax=Rhizobium sp. BK529 TaxID=2586983 RepID=UPI00161B1584|nr:efflux RND transporter periplasmic adaptor subunit [Rhizobium sp. BK529]MBB3595267.1 membrane fusion protein (multidrug efflux system) [Rhizobium sp. BK529]
MRLRIYASLRSCLAASALLVATAVLNDAGAQEGTEPAVEVAPARLIEFTSNYEFLGTVVAIQRVNLYARVSGVLEEVKFTEGGFLKAGEPAFSIEKGGYLAALHSADATLSSAEAALEVAKLNAAQAEITLNRQRELLRGNTTTQAAFDQASTDRDVAVARVHQAQADVAQAKAQVETSSLNLSYTDIAAPISGRIGRALVTKGNLVSQSTGALASVVQTDPIRVVFSISDQQYLAVVRALQKKGQGVGSQLDQFRPRLELSDGTAYPNPGAVVFVDNAVDPQTGTIAVFADFSNPDSLLVPGQTMKVKVEAGEPRKVIGVPAAAIQKDRDGSYVFVLGQDNRATIRRVTTGDKIEGDWSISSGLADGEMVIVAGIQRIHPGIVVRPQPSTAGN